jgi:hypothetical protein
MIYQDHVTNIELIRELDHEFVPDHSKRILEILMFSVNYLLSLIVLMLLSHLSVQLLYELMHHNF